ncbi:MAG: MATE family efflux transporter [Pseudomonadota bacterium]
MSQDKRDLTTGPVRGRLWQLGGPMVLGIAAVMAVPLADSYFLGQLGTEPLAAISYTFPVVLTLTSLAIGIGAGTSSVVSRAIGNGDDERAKRVSTDAMALAILLVVILSTIGYFTISPLFSLLGASGEVLEMIVAYMQIWYLTLPVLSIMMVANNLLRSNGDARTASTLMIGIALINAALNPVFIFGWNFIPAGGIEGAAWASFVARMFAGVLGMWAVAYRDRLLTLSFPSVAEVWESWKDVGKVAVPAGIGNAVNPFGITIVTAILAAYGDDVVAGFGVATRIESFVCIPMLALSAAIGPVAGQNYGASECERVRKAHVLSYQFSAVWSLAMAVLLWFTGPWLATLFSDEQSVIDTITTYLQIVPITLAGYGVAVVAAGGLNSIGKPVYGLGVYLIRTAALYVPLAWFASTMFEPWGVFAAIAVANVIGGVAIVWWSLKTLPGSADEIPEGARQTANQAV